MRALVLYGGWEQHRPELFAEFAASKLLRSADVTLEQSLECLARENLSQYDVLLPIWTFGEITPDQEEALLGAVEEGLGVVAWHGATSSFLGSRRHKHLLGGQFVCHPGGERVSYQVDFEAHHPLTEGLDPLEVTSEQYYFLVDPAIEVVASTVIVSDEMPWLTGRKAPVAWTNTWGSGHVFYCALGHQLSDVDNPTTLELLTRALGWASRGSRSPVGSLESG